MGSITKILTGDNEKVTRTICKQVGLKVRNMLLGSVLEHMSDAELARAARNHRCICKTDTRAESPYCFCSSRMVIPLDLWVMESMMLLP